VRLYDRSGFPNPARIRIVLAEKQLDDAIDFVPVDLIAAEHKQAAFLAINPAGVIPVLELDDGTFISEATAITEYLDNLDGNPVLTGRTPREKAMIHMMQKRAETQVLDPVGIYFHFGTPGLGAALQAYKSPEWAGRSEWAMRNRSTVEAGMRYFDGVLASQPYLAGDAFSMADITLYAGLAFGDAAGLPMADDLTHLRQWRQCVSEIPSVRNRSGQDFLPEDARRLGF
jgi:glutathione S-transferase